ncbi:hypothetical protein ACQKND_00180 [Viridibacillus arvi]|uniref:hypothetical protein n=1 Tax=Viridibacillus arvi TaxID=263475 RepID=UPI003D08E58F
MIMNRNPIYMITVRQRIRESVWTNEDLEVIKTSVSQFRNVYSSTYCRNSEHIN